SPWRGNTASSGSQSSDACRDATLQKYHSCRGSPCSNSRVGVSSECATELYASHCRVTSCESSMRNHDEVLSKVPAVTLGFWVIKILATTLGETGGDAVTMSWLHADVQPENGGYLIGTGIFLAVFVAAVLSQIMAYEFTRWSYWLAIVASTTVGTA